MGNSGNVFATTGIVRLSRGLQKSENAAQDRKMLFPDGYDLARYIYIVPLSQNYKEDKYDDTLPCSARDKPFERRRP